MENQTPEQIAQHYSAMLDSVNLINGIIAGEQLLSEPIEEQKDCVDRNVRHLEIMKVKDFWTTENMTPIDAAIAAGTAFLGS